jgi:PAS domain-containing protein
MRFFFFMLYVIGVANRCRATLLRGRGFRYGEHLQKSAIQDVSISLNYQTSLLGLCKTISSSSVPLILRDDNKNIVHVNRAFENLFLYTFEELKGESEIGLFTTR